MLPREHYLKQPFQDAVNFPNGFEKGGLSDIQARLVRKNGTLISALTIDEVSDPTVDDLHILKVIANQSAPKSPVEQAWIKYLSIVKNLAAANGAKTKAKPKASKAATPEKEEAVAEAAPEKVKASKPTKAAITKEAAPAKKATAKAATEEKPAKAKKTTVKA